MGFLNKKFNKQCKCLIYQDLENIIIESIKNMEFVNEGVDFIENELTDVWISNTLMNNSYRKKHNITVFRFERESQENYYPAKIGKTDIKVIISNISFSDVYAYYIIECKRIDGKKDLIKKYLTNGIKRFISKSNRYYTSYKNNAMMVMYIKNNIDINNCVKSINSLQSLDNDISVVDELSIIDNYKISSKYLVDNELVEIKHFIFRIDNLLKDKPNN